MKKKIILILVTLMVALLFSTSTAFATEDTSNTDTISSNTVASSPEVSFTSAEINTAATKVKTFVNKNNRLPSYVYVGNQKVTMAPFLKLMTQNTINIDNGSPTSIALTNVDNPSSATETIKPGTITKTEYMYVANRIKTHIDSYNKAPGRTYISLGYIKFENLVYSYSRILNFNELYNRLPNTLTINTWKGSSYTPASQGTGPKVKLTDPVNNATNIPTTKLIRIEFTGNIYSSDSSQITLETYSDRVKVPITYTVYWNKIFIDHVPLQNQRTYLLTIKPNFVTGKTGVGNSYTYSIKFKSGTTDLNSFKARLVIPRISANLNIRSDTNNAYNSVKHYASSVYFGTPGECALLGHRTTWGGPLYYINKIRKGDLIYIYDSTAKKRCTYRVQYYRIINNENIPSLKLQGDSILQVRTCNPIGSSYQKYIVYAKLESTIPYPYK